MPAHSTRHLPRTSLAAGPGSEAGQCTQPVRPGAAGDAAVRGDQLESMRAPRLHVQLDAGAGGGQPPRVFDGLSAAEWDWQVGAVTGRLLKDAGLDGQHRSDLAARLPYLPTAQYSLVLGRLAALDPADLPDPGRAAVADSLRAIVRANRRFPEWAMAVELVDQIAAQLERFEDKSTGPESAWLFTHHVELPGPWPKDAEADQRTVQRLREAAVRAVSVGGEHAFWDLAAHCEAPYLLGWTAGLITASLGEDSIIAELDSAAPERWQAARGWVAGRFEAAGWPWAAPYLEAAAAWPAPRIAAFLLALPPAAGVFDQADLLGGEVRERYWKSVQPFAVRDDADLGRAARTLTDLGRADAALTALSIMVQRSCAPDPGLVTDALASAVPSPEMTGSDLTMFVYYVTSLLGYLDGQPSADRHRMAQIEWRYLPALESHERPPRVLHQELAREPEFFAEVIALVYPPEGDGEALEPTEEERRRAVLGYQLLRSWRTVPGTTAAPGGPDLAQWVSQARALLTPRGLLRPGDQFIGQILSHTPEDPDGT